MVWETRQDCEVTSHSADAKAAVEVCVVGLDLSLLPFDVTSSGLRLHTPAQVWAPLRKALSAPPFLPFFSFLKS